MIDLSAFDNLGPRSLTDEQMAALSAEAKKVDPTIFKNALEALRKELATQKSIEDTIVSVLAIISTIAKIAPVAMV